jgi:hypothetical protein
MTSGPALAWRAPATPAGGRRGVRLHSRCPSGRPARTGIGLTIGYVVASKACCRLIAMRSAATPRFRVRWDRQHHPKSAPPEGSYGDVGLLRLQKGHCLRVTAGARRAGSTLAAALYSCVADCGVVVPLGMMGEVVSLKVRSRRAESRLGAFLSRPYSNGATRRS